MPSLRVSFYGASGTVTGSKFLVETDKHKLLVDCGLFQGRKKLRKLNWHEPIFDPKSLSAIVLTHAHIDHTGYLPRVVKRGFTGPIYCTPATARLLQLLLPDSAHLQEEEARFAAKHSTSQHRPPQPLYTKEDAQKALSLLKVFERDQRVELLPGLMVEARCAGHILGSCSLGIEAHGKRILFSGDVGRFDAPLLPDPAPTDLGDLLVCESTYGDRFHADADVKAQLAAVVHRAVERRGPLLIPSFAVGRTQNLLYFLGELEREGKIPHLPVYVDSPMAVDATGIYREFRHDFDEDASKIIAEGEAPLLTSSTTFCRKVEDSKKLNHIRGTGIIISASGMVTGGRILHHMRNWLSKDQATVLFVGFQANGTRGRLIQSGVKEIKIFGQYIPVRAEVESISGLSAHGDRGELLRWLASCSGTPSQVRIVHGEPEPARAFAEGVQEKFGWKAQPAEYKETVEI